MTLAHELGFAACRKLASGGARRTRTETSVAATGYSPPSSRTHAEMIVHAASGVAVVRMKIICLVYS